MSEEQRRQIARKGGEAAAQRNGRNQQGRFEAGGSRATSGQGPGKPVSPSSRGTSGRTNGNR